MVSTGSPSSTHSSTWPSSRSGMLGRRRRRDWLRLRTWRPLHRLHDPLELLGLVPAVVG
jgi:hypothetical protein